MELLTGLPPFFHQSKKGDYKKLMRLMTDRTQPDIPEELSEEAKHFLSVCLKYDMRERATLQQLKQHPFITNAILSQNTSNISDSKSAAIRKRNPKEITDKIAELRLLKDTFPNPAKIG